MTQRMVSFFGFFVLAMTGGATATAQNQEEGKKIYVAYCTASHGEKGKGNGTAAQSLPVRLADHTNGVAMNQLSDKFLIDVISKGGGAMGKSSFMPAWRSSLNERQIRDIVAYLYYHNIDGAENNTGTQTVDGIALNNIQSYYWSGTEYDSVYAWLFLFDNSDQGRDFRGDDGAWAVRPGDVASVPEPGAWLLMGVGFVGVVVARRGWGR